jgi:hypothetical protein
MNPLIRKLERFTRLSDADKRLLQQAASARIPRRPAAAGACRHRSGG